MLAKYIWKGIMKQPDYTKKLNEKPINIKVTMLLHKVNSLVKYHIFIEGIYLFDFLCLRPRYIY